MKRRTFIQTSALASSSLLMPIDTFAFAKERKFKMGLQLFTIRDALEKDPIGSLKKASKMGYEDVEIYGYDIEKGSYYGYPAEDFKKILEDVNMTASSGHYDFSSYFEASPEELKSYVDHCIIGAKALSTKYITWPWLHPDYRSLENFKRMPEKLNAIGEQVKAAGLAFAYHNHDFEFKDYNGENGYDIILKNTDPETVKLQMDMYWVAHSSPKGPIQLIRENPGRYVMWHIKDMDKVTRDYSEMGNGSIDYASILSDIPKKDLEYYYIEQGGNFEKSSMDSIKTSANYFKKNLKKYL